MTLRHYLELLPGTAEKHESDQQVIPYPKKLVYGKRGECWNTQR